MDVTKTHVWMSQRLTSSQCPRAPPASTLWNEQSSRQQSLKPQTLGSSSGRGNRAKIRSDTFAECLMNRSSSTAIFPSCTRIHQPSKDQCPDRRNRNPITLILFTRPDRLTSAEKQLAQLRLTYCLLKTHIAIGMRTRAQGLSHHWHRKWQQIPRGSKSAG